jgi:hypothetical protein
MADTFLLTEGLYDSSTQPNYALHYGSRIASKETRVQQHVPDYGLSTPVRATDPDRTAYFRLHVLADTGETMDDVLNKIATLKRWVDGADQQALRFHRDRDVNEIQLKTKKDGATYFTLHSVKWGFVDDGGSHYSSQKRGTAFAKDVVVMLTLAPYGVSDTTSVMRNDLFSSPHFIEDSNADDLADGWNEVGTPTSTLDTSIALIGNQSQKVLTDDSTTEGIYSDSVTISNSDVVYAYAWVAVTLGNNVTVALYDNVGLIQAKEIAIGDSGGVSDRSAISPTDGSTVFYRVVVTGTASGSATSAYLQIARDIGDADTATVFYVDGCYLEYDSSAVSVPKVAWISSCNIDNRNDIQSTSQATENYLNYIDVWGVPGDVDAQVRWLFSGATASVSHIIGKRTDGVILACEHRHWIEDDEITLTGSDWSSQVDAARTDGTYIQFTAGGSTDYCTLTLTGSDARGMGRGPLRCYAIGKASSASNGVYAEYRVGDVFVANDTVLATNTATWELWDLGLINVDGNTPFYDPEVEYWYFVFRLYGVASSGTVDVDALVFVPTEEFMITPENSDTINYNVIDGFYDRFIEASDVLGQYQYELPVLGTMYRLTPGTVTNRLVVQMHTDTSGNPDHTLADALQMTAYIKPRTRHLLGTT